MLGGFGERFWEFFERDFFWVSGIGDSCWRERLGERICTAGIWGRGRFVLGGEKLC